MPVPAIDWASLTQAELDQLRIDLDAEQVRRYTRATAPAALAAIAAAAETAPAAERNRIRDRIDELRDQLTRPRGDFR